MSDCDRSEQFHAHLDVCEQCREHPFQLCPVGHKLLTGTEGGYILKPDICEVVLKMLQHLKTRKGGE